MSFIARGLTRYRQAYIDTGSAGAVLLPLHPYPHPGFPHLYTVHVLATCSKLSSFEEMVRL
jgi:hypothetical protein